MSEKRLLTICDDDVLLTTRHVILHRAGYKVVSADSPAHGLELLDQQSFDLIIVCHCVTTQVRHDLMARIRTKSACPVLVISAGAADFRINADAYVHGLDSPEDLLKAVAKLV
jgi:DNA-binding response OmpR family regulator